MGSIVNTKGAAERTGLAVATLNNLRSVGGGPRFLKLGRAVRYSEADLEAWLSARVVGSTSERAAA
ncbi:MAG: DNA-binding protein [Alphaproteobacteria bacterium]|nr:MAG: DNA-binding protein [Alphaproteobacteria bacterium]